jgi:RNA polymerase sigma-70 factor (ECF subfamily)
MGAPLPIPGFQQGNNRVDLAVFGRRRAVNGRDRIAAFEQLVLPHARAGYNMARWMTRNDHDAEDVVQEATLRAFKYWDGWRGDNVRTWFLAIVRNLCRDWIQRNRSTVARVEDEAELVNVAVSEGNGSDPEAALIRSATAQAVTRAIETLPPDFREVLLLREQEGLAYKEIAEVARIPIGTVMSRLARARSMVQRHLLVREEAGQA